MGECERKYTGNIHEGLEDRRRYTTPESSGPVVRTHVCVLKS